MLTSIKHWEKKGVVPLSFSQKEYGVDIDKYERSLIGNHFIAMQNLLPLKEYNLLITGCSIAIVNYPRQQALGYIGTILCNGGKLFFRRA